MLDVVSMYITYILCKILSMYEIGRMYAGHTFSIMNSSYCFSHKNWNINLFKFRALKKYCYAQYCVLSTHETFISIKTLSNLSHIFSLRNRIGNNKLLQRGFIDSIQSWPRENTMRNYTINLNWNHWWCNIYVGNEMCWWLD